MAGGGLGKGYIAGIVLSTPEQQKYISGQGKGAYSGVGREEDNFYPSYLHNFGSNTVCIYLISNN